MKNDVKAWFIFGLVFIAAAIIYFGVPHIWHAWFD